MQNEPMIREEIVNKWKPVLEHKNHTPIEGARAEYRKAVTAQLLENQRKDLREAAPIQNMGNDPSGVQDGTPGSVATWDPILMGLVRRAAPNLIAYDICGVQPMTGPTGLVFALTAQYVNNNGEKSEEALFDRSRTQFSGNESLPPVSGTIGDATTGTNTDTPYGGNAAATANSAALYGGHIGLVTGAQPATAANSVAAGTVLPGATGNQGWESDGASWTATGFIYQDPNPAQGDFAGTGDPFESTTAAIGRGLSTAAGEALGGPGAGDPDFNQMGFNIERISVEARTRALKAEYTQETAQDLRNVHGADAETELANILSTEILAEINREVVETIYRVARLGAQKRTTAAGIFNLDTDSNGRWSGEKYQGLLFQIETEANEIAKVTRRGRGNIIICSSDVASALGASGKFNYSPQLSTNLDVDDTGNTFAGVLNGKFRVYIDPYFSSTDGSELCCVGYRGSRDMDAGLFYCPYVPLQMVRAIGENTFQPKIAFKTRYGLVSNPYVSTVIGGNVRDGSNLTPRVNQYYRVFRVDNLT